MVDDSLFLPWDLYMLPQMTALQSGLEQRRGSNLGIQSLSNLAGATVHSSQTDA